MNASACLYEFSILKSVVCYKSLFVFLLCDCVLGKDVTDRWYNEVNQYNFNQPGFSSGTGKHALLLKLKHAHIFLLYNANKTFQNATTSRRFNEQNC